MAVETVRWTDLEGKQRAVWPGRVRFIDQTVLPGQLSFRSLDQVPDLVHAIRTLQIRGAPAIGIAAAFGVVLGIQRSRAASGEELAKEADTAADLLAASRPTAVNLFWALDRMRATAHRHAGEPPDALKTILLEEALQILREDQDMCARIGQNGLPLVRDGMTVLTHCNAGGLATSGYGTALAPIYLAHENGRKIRVVCDETRPLLQGARLTAWELMAAGIPATLICDNTAAFLMKQGRIHLVIVGADRIAANGDTANKIGTYSVALTARHHGIPFYVAAPTSTLDLSLETGDEIPIEERAAEEVTEGFGRRTAPDGIAVYSPAFDVTPHDLIAGIITEKGVARPPFAESLRAMGARQDLSDIERSGNRAV